MNGGDENLEFEEWSGGWRFYWNWKGVRWQSHKIYGIYYTIINSLSLSSFPKKKEKENFLLFFFPSLPCEWSTELSQERIFFFSSSSISHSLTLSLKFSLSLSPHPSLSPSRAGRGSPIDWARAQLCAAAPPGGRAPWSRGQATRDAAGDGVAHAGDEDRRRTWVRSCLSIFRLNPCLTWGFFCSPKIISETILFSDLDPLMSRSWFIHGYCYW